MNTESPSIYVNDRLSAISLPKALSLLPEQRRQKVLAFRHESGQRQSVAAWLLLRQACQEQLGLSDVPPVATGEHGKPFFPTMPDIHFNLSHCREAVACALWCKPVGIDVEHVRPLHESLARYVLNDEEWQQVRNDSHPDLCFVRLWTMKESLLKLTGEGLHNNLKPLLTEAHDVRFSTMVDTSQRYVCTVAVRR